MQGGAAYKDGRLLPNDQIIAINGDKLDNKSNASAMECLRAAMQSDPPRDVIDLVIRRRTDSKNTVLRPLGVRRYSTGDGSESAIDVGCDTDHESDASPNTVMSRLRRKSLPSPARPLSAGKLKFIVGKSPPNRSSMVLMHERSYSDDVTTFEVNGQQRGQHIVGEIRKEHGVSLAHSMLKSLVSPEKSPRANKRVPLQSQSGDNASVYLSPGELLISTNDQLASQRDALSPSCIELEVGSTTGQRLPSSSSKTSLDGEHKSAFVPPIKHERENQEPIGKTSFTTTSSTASSPRIHVKQSPSRVSQSSSVASSSPSRKRNGSTNASSSVDNVVEPSAKRQPLHETQETVNSEEKELSLDLTHDSPFQRDAVGRLSMSERRKTALDPSSSKVYQERQQKLAGQTWLSH